jgi:hypothetical protein
VKSCHCLCAFFIAPLQSNGRFTDSGEPLHLVIFNPEKSFNLAEIQKNKAVLINNGIHAGEPDGIDATMQLFRDLLGENQNSKNTIISTIPIYNIGGALNRNSTTRANQDGQKYMV